ncbi:AEC family transporter [Lichenibacterium ramalinae]|uniref:AEC family transporter n=1 Tax=Lichenibacterium ramalinae TaxID=2316527 RepID=A0A4Q2R955_9HYPH|nr:AEC family transporter [Lichenibacterium ramalinae]RYB02627.1 AEC family transporter [Lichenibacterium ramalinae]
MQSVIDAVLPVFALIGIGYLAAASGVLDAGVTDALNRFVVWLALPALLFAATAKMSFADIDHPGFAVASGGAMAATFGLSMVLDRRRGKRLADRAIEGLDAAYANSGFLGIPLGLALFGNAILPALVISVLLTACLLFAFAIVLIEADLARAEGGSAPGRWATLVRTAASLARNPLLVSPVAGGIWAATGLALPLPADRFLGLLGAAASPCALVTIGLFLHQQRERADTAEVARLVGLKLVGQPLFALAFAWLVPMPKPWFDAAVLLAALPTGTGPFMLAKLYGREAAATSRAILVSTVLSVVTVSALVAWLGR